MKNLEIGTLVTVSDAIDACVYVVTKKHHTNKYLYWLTYNTAIGPVDANWQDCSLFKIPTQQQLNHEYNKYTAQNN